MAIGPILAVVAVGFSLTVLLEGVDSHYGLTEKVIAGLDEMDSDFNAYLQKRKEQALKQAGQIADSVIDYALEAAQRTAIHLFKNAVDRAVPARPRL